ncbi:MAG: hypothetical protein ACKVN9_11475 [Methylophilaceae bacterium]
MPPFNSTIATIGCYPVWATETVTCEDIDTITSRLIELAHQYHADTLKKSNAAAARFVCDLLDALHADNPATLHPLIDSYHIAPEFDRLLRLADSAMRGEEVREQFAVEAKRICILNKALAGSRKGVESHHHPKASKKLTDQIKQDIVDAANKLPSRLSTSARAAILSKQFDIPAGTIRNLLTPLRIRHK